MMESGLEIRRQFMAELAGDPGIEQLFNHLPDVCFFAKDRQGRFVMGNDSFARQCGVRCEDELLGMTDFDFFPTDLAGIYVRDDQEVMSTGRSIINRVELFADSDGQLNWFTTTKIPLFNRVGDLAGVAGTTQDIHKAHSAVHPYKQMPQVVQFIREHFSEQIGIAELAQLVNLSVSQFQRRFKSVFHITPLQYINRIRINAACRQLRENNDTISTVAQRCGFYDHSYFTKQFVKNIGMRPKEYRSGTEMHEI
jgi:PAS domain S-box-containing protein